MYENICHPLIDVKLIFHSFDICFFFVLICYDIILSYHVSQIAVKEKGKKTLNIIQLFHLNIAYLKLDTSKVLLRKQHTLCVSFKNNKKG